MSVHAQVGQYSNKKLGDISDQMNIYEKKKEFSLWILLMFKSKLGRLLAVFLESVP